MLKKIIFLSFLTATLGLSGCAGVFTNPDLAHGVDQASFRFEVALPPLIPLERQIIQVFRDTGTVRIPEHDYYRLQDYILNAITRYYQPKSGFRGFTDSLTKKDITRIYNQDSPQFATDDYLQQFSRIGFTVYRLDSCSTELLRAFISNGVPVLMYGMVTIKRTFAAASEITREDGNVSKGLYRKFETFDLIYGYQKTLGPRMELPGEQGDEYVFNVRTTLDFKMYGKKEVINRAHILYGGKAIHSIWLTEVLYIVLPQDKPAKEVFDRVFQTAAAWGMAAKPAAPKRIF